MKSAGILVFRKAEKEIEFFLVHPGGLFCEKNEGFWTIPKGLFDENEKPIDAAKREFAEETGFELHFGVEDFLVLDTVTQKGGKLVYGFAVEFNLDETAVVSNTFEIEWPPKSRTKKTFPEIDRAGWFKYGEAEKLINSAQAEFLHRLVNLI